MAYVLCLIYVAVSYIRPAELVPALIPFHVAETTGILAVAAAVFSLLLRPRPVLNLPLDWFFLGFIAIAFVADPLGASAARLDETAQVLLPLAAFYVLIRVTVESRRQLHVFIAVLCLLAVFQAASAAMGFTSLRADTDIVDEQAPADIYADDPEVEQQAGRLVGSGMYGDPNDLSTSLLTVLPFLFSVVLSARSAVVLRIASIAAIGVIGYTIQLAQSRGGFLALAALVGAYAYRRFGRVAAVVVLAAVVVAALAMGPSRLQQLDTQEASAQGRIEAWAAGLQMLKSHPVLGVGFNQFARLHARVAHNSFMHSFAELGFAGGFLFVGMFYWHFFGRTPPGDAPGTTASTLGRDLFASGVGVATAAAFLSLQYIPILYVPLVLGAVRITVERQPGASAPAWRAWDWAAIGVLSVLAVAATYAAVRLLGSWAL